MRTTIRGRAVRGQPRNVIVAGHRVGRPVRAADAVLRPLFGLFPFPGPGVLTTVGRKTGKARRHCVRVVRRGDRAYLVAIAGAKASWLWNIRSNPRVQLRLGGETIDGMAREPARGPELDEAREAYVETVNPSEYFECLINWSGLPTRAKIQRLREIWSTVGSQWSST